MGGVVPLGYRVSDRALHIVEEHASFYLVGLIVVVLAILAFLGLR